LGSSTRVAHTVVVCKRALIEHFHSFSLELGNACEANIESLI